MIGLESSRKEIFSIYHFDQRTEKLCLVLEKRCVRGRWERRKMWLRLIERLGLVLCRHREKEGRLVALAELLGCWMRAVPAGEKGDGWALPARERCAGRGSTPGLGLLLCLECPCSAVLSASPRAPVPARAGAGARGIIGWLQPSPCPLICGERSHPRGTARWWALMCPYL